ncbi:conserved hypothetical protein [Streptococcus equi subsp. zooepidemicus ATCC 35246]|nr:conserved hypothetical protein [Streptococcus equi subsp. zooepidemicus ATCC 35246]AIA68884.1 hypothetical protein Q426_07575 [Streptococcus equi subsp. zooepidemicus CY]
MKAYRDYQLWPKERSKQYKLEIPIIERTYAMLRFNKGRYKNGD